MKDVEVSDVVDGTWPAARIWAQDGWVLRDGAGGGKRVSAATQVTSSARIADAETAMCGMGQTPLFMIRKGDDALDATLAEQGYRVVDPVNLYACPVAHLMDVAIPPVTAFSIWEPLAIMSEIWAQGGIGAERLAVMARTQTKTGILSRWNEKPAGVAFAAVHERIAMVHAVEVLSHQRRNGVAAWMMRKAAFWAAEQGAERISVLCTEENHGANSLYSKLGMTLIGGYHYRIKDA